MSSVHVTEVRPLYDTEGTIDAIALGPESALAIAVSGARDAGLYAGEVGSSTWRKLVGYPSWRSPRLSWSPDGAFIAFQIEMDPPGGYDDQVGIAVPDKRGEHVRYSGQAFGWASAGAVLYVSNGTDLSIDRHDVHKGRTRSLGEYGHHYSELYRPQVAPAPDGRHVAYTSRNMLQQFTYVYCMGKKSGLVEADIVTRVPGTSVHVMPFWSPKGKSLGLHMVHDEHAQTGTVIIKGLEGDGEIYYTREGVDPVVAPAWVPDGDSIVLQRQDGALISVDLQSQEISEIVPAGRVSGRMRFLDEDRLALEGEGVAYVLDGFDSNL